MLTRCVRFSALVVLAAVLGINTAPAFVGAPHTMCAPKEHDCGRTARIVQCCCDDQSGSSTPAGTIETRVQAAAVTVLVCQTAWARPAPLDSALTHAGVVTSRAGPIDFPTLFSTLLI